jgi:hypothetical protein
VYVRRCDSSAETLSGGGGRGQQAGGTARQRHTVHEALRVCLVALASTSLDRDSLVAAT